jgi:regulator of protease activity HflC (stomatin/prohibitin superfamily)
MKKILQLSLLALLLAGLTTSCYRVQPDPGVESVLVYKPYIFGHGGVDDTPVSTGSTWCVVTTEHKEFPITPITITEDFTNMIPSDNTPVSFSVYLKCQIRKGETPILYKNFGANWYENNLQASFRTMVRDKASAFKMFELASKREISSQLEKDIFNDIAEYTKKINLPVTIMQVSIGAVTPPEQVLTETKNTAAQNQSILTQKARADAELSRKQAEINKAIADMAYQKEMKMTIAEYLHLRQLEIEKEKVELIKDNKDVTIIFGGNSLPVTYPVK